MNLKDKKTLSTLLVHAIIALVLFVLFVAIPTHKGAAGWIAMGFSLIAIAASFFITIYAFGKGSKLVSKVYGFPIARVGFLYAATQIVVLIVICIVAAFVKVPAWVSIVLSFLLLGAAAIGIIITDNIRDHVEAVDEKTQAETKNVSYFRTNLSGLTDRTTDPEIRKAIEKLEDELRYSDPVSSEATKESEGEIEERIDGLKGKMDGEKTETLQEIGNIANLLRERNRICKNGKGGW